MSSVVIVKKIAIVEAQIPQLGTHATGSRGGRQRGFSPSPSRFYTFYQLMIALMFGPGGFDSFSQSLSALPPSSPSSLPLLPLDRVKMA